MKSPFLYFFGLLCSLLVSLAVRASNGFKKYESLLNTVDKAEGRAVLYLSSGYYTVSLAKKTYLINTDPKNADTKKIAVAFKYANGSITSLKIVFTPAIHIALLGNKCVSLKVDSLTYDQDGDRLSDQCGYSWDSTCKSPNTSQLLDALNPNLDYDDLFSGRLFESQPKFTASDANGAAVAPQYFIYRVFFNDPGNAGLLVSFKQGKQWIMSEKASDGASNEITFNAASVANFKRIDYNLMENTLDVRLDNAIFNLQDGHIETANFRMNIENNTSLTIGSIKFTQNGADYDFVYSGSRLTANVSAGSSLTLASNTLSSLQFDNGSHIDLQGLFFEATNSTVDLSFQAGSIFNIRLLSGNLPLGDNGSIGLDKSQLDLDLSGTYSKGNRFNTLGSIINIDLTINSGKVYFNGSQDPLLVQSGKIRAKNIIINSQAFPYLTGAFDFVQLVCDYNSELSIKNSIDFSLQRGALVTFGDKNFPFTLLAGEKFPIGRFYADIGFANFRNHKLGSLTIGTGRAKGYFRLIQGENCLVDSLSLNGNFALNFSLQNAPVNANGQFFLRNGFLTYANGEPELQATISFTVAKGAGYYPIEIQGNYDNGSHEYIEKERITQYPANVAVKLANDITIPETNVAFKQNLITVSPVSVTVSANLTVPPGNGEHEYPDGHFNGDGIQGKQEVARYDIPDPGGVMHFYINPQDAGNPYTVSSKVTVASTEQQNIAITFADLSIDRPLGYDTDGGKGPFQILAAAVVTAVGGSICGACSLPAGVLAYIKAGDFVNGIIQGKIYSFLQDFNNTLLIKAQ